MGSLTATTPPLPDSGSSASGTSASTPPTPVPAALPAVPILPVTSEPLAPPTAAPSASPSFDFGSLSAPKPQTIALGLDTAFHQIPIPTLETPKIEAPKVETPKIEPLQSAQPKPVSGTADPLASSIQAQQTDPFAPQKPLTPRQEQSLHRKQAEAHLKAEQARVDGQVRAIHDRQEAKEKASRQEQRLLGQQRRAELKQQEALDKQSQQQMEATRKAQEQQAETQKAQLQQGIQQLGQALGLDTGQQQTPGQSPLQQGVRQAEPAPRRTPLQAPAYTSEQSRRPLKVDRALHDGLPPVGEDPSTKWNGSTHPGKESIAAARRKSVGERSYGDQSKIMWDDRYWTDEHIQRETSDFHKLNPGKTESYGPGHPRVSTPFGREGIDEMNTLINRHRADQAIGRLGDNPDPDHVRLVEEHYGLREPLPQPDTPALRQAQGKQDRVVDTGEHTITVDWTPKPDGTMTDDMISGSASDDHLHGDAGDDILGKGDAAAVLDDTQVIKQNPDGSYTVEQRPDPSSPLHDDTPDYEAGAASDAQAGENNKQQPQEASEQSWWDRTKDSVVDWAERLDPSHPDNPHQGIPEQYFKVLNPTKHQLVKDIIQAGDADAPELRKRIEETYSGDPDSSRREMALGLLERRGDMKAVGAYLNGGDSETNRWNRLTRDDPTPAEMAAMSVGGIGAWTRRPAAYVKNLKNMPKDQPSAFAKYKTETMIDMAEPGSFSQVKRISGQQANNEVRKMYSNQGKTPEGDAFTKLGHPGYREDLPVYEASVGPNGLKLVRTHGDEGKPAGRWSFPDSETRKHLGYTRKSAEEIRADAAMPQAPSFASEVNLPPGTKIRIGTAASHDRWGEGNALQIEILGEPRGNWFSHTRALGQP